MRGFGEKAPAFRTRSGNEGAADSGALGFGFQYVDFAEADAHGRQDRDVQDGVELAGEIVRIIDVDGYAAVAEVYHRGAISCALAERGVGASAGQRNTFPFALLAGAWLPGGRGRGLWLACR